MRTSRRTQVGVELMEGKALLSLGGWTLPGLTHSLISASGRHPSHLAGSVSGAASGTPTNPDTGHATTVSGTGRVANLGQVTASGTFRSPGFIAHGRATGTVTLANERGGVTVRLTGPVQKGFSPLPSHFAYTIEGGTGAYRSMTGSGHATLALDPSAGTFTLTFRA